MIKTKFKGLDLLLEDFGEISKKAFELKEINSIRTILPYHIDLTELKMSETTIILSELKFFNEEKIVWWGEREGYEPEVPIGKPEDYLKIRENYEELELFIAKILDKGIVEVGHTRGGSFGETNCANYISWLYKNSQNQNFKRNVEGVLTKLLSEELQRKFDPLNLDIETCYKGEDKYFNELYAKEAFSSQFKRLIGLLQVVSSVGEKNEKFFEIYKILKENDENKFRINPEDIIPYHNTNDIYWDILRSLVAVQRGSELQQFWLDNIHNGLSSLKYARTETSVEGILKMHDSLELRRNLIPFILEKFQQTRGEGEPEEETRKKSYLNGIEKEIHELCFDGSVFNHLDSENIILDYLQKREIGKGKYTFIFDRYTPKGAEELKAIFDLTKNTIEGDKQLKDSIDCYLQRGYELPNDVWVTSLEGRKIVEINSKVVEIYGLELDGAYEGIIGLNNTHFGFIYYQDTQEVLLSDPLDIEEILIGKSFGWEENLMFGDRIKGWDKSKMGLDNINNKVPYPQFLDINQTGKRIDQLVAERRKSAKITDCLFELEQKIDENITPYLVNIIDGRLIQNSDGLVS